jgi:hypothetical protein
MLTYKDRAWCSSSNDCLADCYRRLTPAESARAVSLHLPVSYMDFKGRPECPGFKPKPD